MESFKQDKLHGAPASEQDKTSLYDVHALIFGTHGKHLELSSLAPQRTCIISCSLRARTASGLIMHSVFSIAVFIALVMSVEMSSDSWPGWQG